eukprot:TRINITY_DN3322_c0_g1_i1.p1 TRINITY_DN3322_c0_g1~~TRINITY_DN3322_c0_g1_i1.p1  ORF type:complete len:424 (-),score=85.21 TRINITY_DN3322_c0_g1_i1:67-1167(-)
MKADSRGKELRISIISESSDVGIVYVTFAHGLNGKWVCCSNEQAKSKYAKGHYVHFQTTDGYSICFTDGQKIGRWVLGSWGDDRSPDPLLEFDAFRRNVINNTSSRSFNKQICDVLLNQSYFNGIGNYLRAEILFRARVDFNALAKDLFEAHDGKCSFKGELILALCNKIPQEVLDLGLNKYGTITESRKFNKWLQCYGKQCSIKQGGRTVWYCDDIQNKEYDEKDLQYLSDLSPETGIPKSGNAIPVVVQQPLKKAKKIKKIVQKPSPKKAFILSPTPQVVPETQVKSRVEKKKTEEKLEFSEQAKLLYLISLLWKAHKIEDREKEQLKRFVFEGTPSLFATLEYFEAENDFDEVADTFKLICSF